MQVGLCARELCYPLQMWHGAWDIHLGREGGREGRGESSRGKETLRLAACERPVQAGVVAGHKHHQGCQMGNLCCQGWRRLAFPILA